MDTTTLLQGRQTLSSVSLSRSLPLDCGIIIWSKSYYAIFTQQGDIVWVFTDFQESLLKQFMNTEFPGSLVKFLLRVLEMNEAMCCKSQVLIHHHTSYLGAEAQTQMSF